MDVAVSFFVYKETEVVSQCQMLSKQNTYIAIHSEAMSL